MLEAIRASRGLSHGEMARLFGTSLVSLHRWITGTAQPSPAVVEQIRAYHQNPQRLPTPHPTIEGHGLGRTLPLFQTALPTIELGAAPLPPILERIADPPFLDGDGAATLRALFQKHASRAPIADAPPAAGMSAGKNTYTYDAHTYHTKVPPQGIVELLRHYLPQGGLVLDPFAGSGMTGVATRLLGYDCILNELSPAAALIARQFTAQIDPELFEAGVASILRETSAVREDLYTTNCRECGKATELLYVVWSYEVLCPHCEGKFQLWDHCRSYGSRVKEHKILTSFACPSCHRTLKKSSLSRTQAHPVMVGYKCCGSRQQEVTHPPSQDDLDLIAAIEAAPPIVGGAVPDQQLYAGVNLRQPMKHGIDSVDKFYTSRNLAAMSQLWSAINRVQDNEVAAFLAFVFTSLYQRVTRLSEFRFWGGSGNTARFNVPYIFNETNVFLTFARKARSIGDHLRTTARSYTGSAVVMNGSATSLMAVPDESVDLIFTDPPFGANINYSEMNILWEAWLGTFTDSSEEVIINKYQHKDVHSYATLITKSMKECFRVLRPDGWMLLMFMNTSSEVWEALRTAVVGVGFSIVKIDLFDKQHGTFKQFVNEHTAGFDLVLHCRKQPSLVNQRIEEPNSIRQSIVDFVNARRQTIPYIAYLHVRRADEIDYRQLYSEWLSTTIASLGPVADFPVFRKVASELLGTELRPHA
jgi:DNA modification methylase/predicted RNA-binding Zn-ribbon protein involved in translation (DUF1610 family)